MLITGNLIIPQKKKKRIEGDLSERDRSWNPKLNMKSIPLLYIVRTQKRSLKDGRCGKRGCAVAYMSLQTHKHHLPHAKLQSEPIHSPSNIIGNLQIDQKDTNFNTLAFFHDSINIKTKEKNSTVIDDDHLERVEKLIEWEERERLTSISHGKSQPWAVDSRSDDVVASVERHRTAAVEREGEEGAIEKIIYIFFWPWSREPRWERWATMP